jgi:hypothetical protein
LVESCEGERLSQLVVVGREVGEPEVVGYGAAENIRLLGKADERGTRAGCLGLGRPRTAISKDQAQTKAS